MNNNTATLIAELTDIATRFRISLEKVLQTLRYVPPPFGNFPSGSCGICPDMLGGILNETREGQVLYVGASDRMGQRTHAWLRYHDIVIDVTGDQFPGRPRVFVGPPDDWFDQWTVDEPLVHPAGYLYSWDIDSNRIFGAESQFVHPQEPVTEPRLQVQTKLDAFPLL